MASIKSHDAPSTIRAIRIVDVSRLTSMSRSTIWRRLREDNSFPSPFKIAPGITAWDEREILKWIEAKKSSQTATHQ